MTTGFGEPPAPVASTKYLGVPNNYAYTPPDNRPGGFFGLFKSLEPAPMPVAPQYQTGDELDISSMPPEVLARLQQQMATAGLIGSSTKIRVGLADDATVNAFKQLLTFANVNGMNWTDALQKLVATPLQSADSTGGSSSSAVHQTNPIDEDYELRTTAQRLIGRDPTPQQLEGFRPYYDALNSSAQTQTPTQPLADDGTVSTTSPPTVTDAPNLTSAADSYLRQNAGIQVQGENLSHVMDALDGLISGSGEGEFGQKGNS